MIAKYNLMNDGFGFTSIKSLYYVLTALFRFLSANFAFIVFTSSLLDLLRGPGRPHFCRRPGVSGSDLFSPFLSSLSGRERSTDLL